MPGITKVTDDFLSALRRVVGEGRFYTGEHIKSDLAHDEKTLYGTAMPDAAVEVSSTEETAAVLKLCNENRVPVTVRGAGTGLCGGSVAADGGVMLCMGHMNRIVELDEDNMTITVQPAVTLKEIMEAAAEKGLCYPPDPGEKTASIGGNVCTNAGGPLAAHYGTTRDYVLGLTAVLPTGEAIKLGGSVIKNNDGLDLLQLIVGSEGTLAVVTEITLKLIPKKKYDISFILPYEVVEEAMSAAISIKKSGLDPVRIELMTKEMVEFSAAFTGEHVFPEDAGADLLVTFESNNEDYLDMLMEQFAEVAEETGPADILVVDTPTLRKSVWAAHAAFQTAVESGVKRFDESDAAVPMTRVAEYIEFVKSAADEQKLNIQLYVHAMDGGMHIFVFNDELSAEEFLCRSGDFMEASYKKCIELCGAVSGEHGIGSGKKAYLESVLGKDVMELMRRVKAAFDPNGILNPGKVM
ncbi:MAG: FAD-binding oxidoreductase [Bacteroidia bacterium]|nr:FAD-binding oxidoreductase [Bacteroidia bacterium]